MSPAEELFRSIKQGGASAIQALVAQKLPESTWLDYKTIVNRKTGNEDWDSLRKYFSKAVSGFGNSDGGLLIWGVDCPEEVPTGQLLLSKASYWAGKMNDLITSATRPSHSLVQNLAFPVSAESPEGFVVSYIPVAPNRPLQALQAGSKDFFVRAGSEFGEAPYSILIGILHRGVPTNISATISCRAGYGLVKEGIHSAKEPDSEMPFLILVLDIDFANQGPTIARECFLTAHWSGLHYSNIQTENARLPLWDHRNYGRDDFERTSTVMANSGLRVAPGETIKAMALKISLPLKRWRLEGRIQRFVLDVRAGAEGAVPFLQQIEFSAQRLDNIAKDLLNSGRGAISYRGWDLDVVSDS